MTKLQGYQDKALLVSIQCVCGPGYANQVDDNNECIPCSEGKFRFLDMPDCDWCSPGSFNNATAQVGVAAGVLGNSLRQRFCPTGEHMSQRSASSTAGTDAGYRITHSTPVSISN
jgi:hypothetical protein